MHTSDTFNIDNELSVWKEKIESILEKFSSLPSGKKAKMMGAIMEIHILASELEGRIEDLKESGFDDGEYWKSDVKVDIDTFRSDFTETPGTYMDYDYSG